MCNVRLFSLPPRRFLAFHRVGATLDYYCDRLAEAATDFIERRLATLILDGVVQQCGDGFVLIAAMFHDDGRHGQQMGQIRLARRFPPLRGMQHGRISQGFGKTVNRASIKFYSIPG